MMIQLQWFSTPKWLPSVILNQQVNHITTSQDRAEEIRQFMDGQPRPKTPELRAGGVINCRSVEHRTRGGLSVKFRHREL